MNSRCVSKRPPQQPAIQSCASEDWPRSPPIGPKDLKEPRRQHGVAVLAAFARLDVNRHPRAVDRGDLQMRDLPDP
jgi:hypothetical protein